MKIRRLVSRIPKKLIHSFFVLLLFFFIGSGFCAIDYGPHPDESGLINFVTDTTARMLFLPGQYDYPTLYYYISLPAFLPEVLKFYRRWPSELQRIGQPTLLFFEDLAIISRTPYFLLRVRTIFLIVSSLTLIWCYLGVLRWRKDWKEAFLAAAVLGLSWEWATHARWIATDAVMTQFGMLAIMCVFYALNSDRTGRWLKRAAIAVGCACGTKYTGGALLLPVFTAGFFFVKKNRLWDFLFFLLTVCFLFFLAFMITTPAIIIDWVRLFVALQNEVVHYQMGHDCYTVNGGWEHLSLILGYFAFVVFSNVLWIALFFFVMAWVGVFALVRQEKWKLAAVFLCYPIFHLSLMSMQRVMFVRNLVILMPFFAILSARGIMYLSKHLDRWRPLQIVFYALVIGLLGANAVWLFRGSVALHEWRRTNYIAEVSEYIDRHPNQKFVLSPKALHSLFAFNPKHRSNIVPDGAPDGEFAVFYPSEVPETKLWTTNRFDYAVRWFGPPSANYNYYPTFPGADKRIGVMKLEKAKKLRVFSGYPLV